MNYKIFISIIFSFIVFNASSQSYKFLYYLDNTLSPVSKDQASIIGKGYEQDGHCILNCFDKATGKMLLLVTAKDSSLEILNGLFKSFYPDMTIESEGNYNVNEMDGVWKYWNKDGYIRDSMIYSRGVRTAYGSYTYYFTRPDLKELHFNDGVKDTLFSFKYSFTDSLKNTFTEKQVSIIKGKETLNFEVNFIGDRGLLKQYDSTGAVKHDSVFTRKLQDADFKGGEDGWRNFLRRTLNPNVAADNNAPDGKYTVIVKFIVGADGNLYDIGPENDPGYGTAAEAIRVLKSSPKWQPAIKYGIFQRAYRRQPITFLIEGQGR